MHKGIIKSRIVKNKDRYKLNQEYLKTRIDMHKGTIQIKNI